MFPLIVLAVGGPGDIPPASSPAQLISVTVIGVALVVALISWLKVHPFIALTGVAIALGIAAGLDPAKSVTSFTTGFGSTMGGVGVLIGLGAMFGKLLADSGGAESVVDALLKRAGPRALPWVMALIGAIVGLPMFFEVGLVLLMPIILLVARRSDVPLMKIAIPTIAGLSVMHGLVPPHPGPLVAVSTLGANMGLTLVIGIALAIPVLALSGPFLSMACARMVTVQLPGLPLRARQVDSPAGDLAVRGARTSAGVKTLVHDGGRGGAKPEVTKPSPRPSLPSTILGILLPIACMLARAVSDSLAPNATDPASLAIKFIGTPTIALGLALVYAMIVFGRSAKLSRKDIERSAASALHSVAGILLIVGAGGGLKQVLIDAGIGGLLARAVLGSGISIVLLAWVIAALVRIATGSATVATVTAAGILAPLAASLSTPEVSLLVVAIGAGSLFLSHVNDPGFWMVKEYLGLSVSQTFKTWTLMESVLSVSGLAGALLMEALL